MRLPGNIRCNCGTIGRTGGRGYLPSASTALPFLTTDSVSSALMRPRACGTSRVCFVSTLRAITVPPGFRSRSRACAGRNIRLALPARRSWARLPAVPIFATSMTAMPDGVLNIIVSPSGENALSWKYSVDPPASPVRRTMRWPVAASIHSLRPERSRTAPAIAAPSPRTT